ncbi:MAG: flippase-like domain-containing protein [Planctomycetaceae bacterium]|nr:flippase-like domain-containing protein [Planctomycetaceae bacterium]
MSRSINILVQVLLIGGIFGFLFWSAFNATDSEGKNVFVILLEQPKRYGFLVAAFWIQFLAVALVIIRWRWLLRTLGLQCSRTEAFRFGFFGMMVNLAPLGIVGGDAAKAILIAQRNPESRSQAVASVFIDRLIGLLTMFLCGTALLYYTGFYARPDIIAQVFTYLVVASAAAGLLGTGIVFLPFFAKGHIERQIAKIPVCGKLLSKFVNALLMYRNHKRCLLQCALLTIPVHFLCGLSLYFTAVAIFPTGGEGAEALTGVPDWIEHAMLHCITNTTTLLPLSAGPYELVFEQFYQLYGMTVGMGFIVSLMYRFICVCTAIAGMVYYYASMLGPR